MVAVPNRSWTTSSPSSRSAGRRGSRHLRRRSPAPSACDRAAGPARRRPPGRPPAHLAALRTRPYPTCSVKRPDYPASPMTARKKWILGAAAAVLLVLVAGGAVFALTRPPADVNNEDVAFEPEPTVTAEPTPAPTEPPAESKAEDPLRNFVWAGYGYSKDRRRFLPASKLLRPPFRRVWTYPGSILLEFSPAMAEGKLFLLRNNGALHAVDKRTGKAVWKKKIGVLAASTPAYGNGRIFATVLSRGKSKAGAVFALDAKTGKILWKRLLPSRSESSPVFDGDRVYFGSENGTIYN